MLLARCSLQNSADHVAPFVDMLSTRQIRARPQSGFVLPCFHYGTRRNPSKTGLSTVTRWQTVLFVIERPGFSSRSPPGFSRKYACAVTCLRLLGGPSPGETHLPSPSFPDSFPDLGLVHQDHSNDVLRWNGDRLGLLHTGASGRTASACLRASSTLLCSVPVRNPKQRLKPAILEIG